MFYVLILVFTCLKKTGAVMAGNSAAAGRANSYHGFKTCQTTFNGTKIKKEKKDRGATDLWIKIIKKK